MKKNKTSRDIDLVQGALERFQEAAEAESANRERFLLSLTMESGDQWDPDVKREREGRPCPQINKLTGVVRQITGDQRQNKPSIKVVPVDSNTDPELAEIYNGIIRNIEQTSGADAAYDHAFECAVKAGWGYFRILTDYVDDDAFEQDICIERIVNPLSVYIDPAAVKADRSDMRYAFVVDELPEDEFRALYPGKELTGWEGGDKHSGWRTDEAIRVAEYFYLEPYVKTLYLLADGRTINAEGVPVQEVEGFKVAILEEGPIPIERERKSEANKVKWCKLYGGGILEEREWAGKYIPIVAVLGEEIWLDNELVLRSAIANAIDAQRIYNWMSATAVETIAQAPKSPFLLTERMIEGHEDGWQDLANRPVPYVLVNADPSMPSGPQRLAPSIADTGALQEAQKAADDIKSTTGIYDASLGARSNETSGRAIMARQREGDVSTYVFIDNLSRSLRYAGKILVDLIPKIYDTARIVRIIGDDKKDQFIPINTRVQDYTSETGFRVINDLSTGRMDVTVKVGPSYTTQRQEAAESMLAFIQAVPNSAQLIVDLLAENMDWPQSEEIAKRMKKLLPPGMDEDGPPQPQGPSPEQMKAELEAQKGQLELQKGQMDLQGKAMDLEAKQMQMVGGIMQEKADIEQAVLQVLGKLGFIGG